MLRLRNISILILLLLVLKDVHAQTQDSYEYQSEFTWGINKNTASGLIGGLVFKKARKKSEKVLETFGLEIMNVKHPQEVRTSSLSTGNYYIYGKSNFLYALRLQYGRDFILFKKAPQQGVEIKAIFAAGPTIGVVAPYYVTFGSDQNTSYSGQYDPNNPNMAPEMVTGSGRLFQGLGESEITPGLNVKAALNFELGTVKSQVTGFEIGFLFDGYVKKIEMMPQTENYWAYPTLFITLFYGSRK